MGLFGDTRPKGITKDELTFVRNELLASSFGHSAEKLSQRQVDEIMEELMIDLDADTHLELKHGWGQVSPQEVAQIEENARNGDGVTFTEPQIAHIHRVLEKYISIDRHKSLF